MKIILSIFLVITSMNLHAQLSDLSYTSVYQNMMIKRNGGQYCDTIATQFDTIDINKVSEKGKAFLFGMVAADISYFNIFDIHENVMGVMGFNKKLISNSEVDSIFDSFMNQDIIMKLEESVNNRPEIFKIFDSFCVVLIENEFDLHIINVVQGILTSQKKYINFYLNGSENNIEIEKLDDELNNHKEEVFRYLKEKIDDKKLVKEYKKDCDQLYKKYSFKQIVEYQREMIFH